MSLFHTRAWGTALALPFLALVLAAQTPPAKTRSDKDPGDPSKPKGTASIEGSAVDAVNGKPVKDATLLLIDIRGTGASATVKTDDAGHFLFQNLSDGSYMLMGDHPRYARQSYGSRNGLFGASPLNLTAGQEMKNVKFELQPNAVISGRVLDDAGDPVANYMVTASRGYYQHGRKQYIPVGTAITDDLGEFRVANLAAGKYLVAAVKSTRDLPKMKDPDGAEMAYLTTYFPNSPEVSGAAPVQVTPGGDVSGTDIRLARTKCVHIKGKVIGVPSGQQVTVRAVAKDAGMLAMILGNSATVKPDGGFELNGVTPGDYILRASDPAGMKPMGAGLPIQVGDKSIESLLLEVTPSSDLTGTVKWDGEDKGSFAGVKVVLEAVEGLTALPPNTAAGEDGAFTLKDVAPDKYLVRVTGQPPGAYLKSVQYGSQEVTEHGLTMGGGPEKLAIKISSAGGNVSGIVHGQDDQPISGVTVALIPDSHNYLLYQTTFTDQRGSFNFQSVAPAQYKVLAWEDVEPNAFEDPEFVKPFESKAESVTIKENDRRSVTLKAIPRG